MSVTGENEQGLRKIIDLTRFASIFILLLHFYYFLLKEISVAVLHKTLILNKLIKGLQFLQYYPAGNNRMKWKGLNLGLSYTVGQRIWKYVY